MTKLLTGIGKRLKEIRKYLNQTQQEFASSLNISQQALSKYENEDLQIPDEIKEILFKNGININWLLTGEGEMFRKSQDDYDKIKKENEELKKQLEELKGATFYRPKSDGTVVATDLPDHIDSNSIISIDLLPFFASAGPGQEITQEELIKSFPILKDLIFNREAKVIIAKGDSMTGISIFDGDFVFFKPETKPNDGIYVFSIGNEIFIKRLVRDPEDGKILIISENKLYPEEVRIKKVDPDTLQILGKVIGWIHKHPY